MSSSTTSTSSGAFTEMPQAESKEQNNTAVERLVADELQLGESEPEHALRPQSFSEMVGQREVVDNLKVFVKAARERGEPLDHVLLSGPPGLGKTTLAHLLALEMGSAIHVTSGPAVERKDLAGILSHLEAGDVLFIDEIHRLSPIVEEILYPAMEDFKIDFVVRSASDARAFQIDLPHFTLIGATTRSGLLTGPMRDRFGIVSRLKYYTTADIEQVLARSSRLMGVACSDEGVRELACRSRGTPRIANRLLRRVRDFAEVEGDGRVTQSLARHALSRLGIDELGFDEIDRALLDAIVRKFGGGPVGLDTLAAVLGEDSDTLESVYEPFLLQEGYIQRTPRGRVATPLAWDVLGLSRPDV